MAATKPPSKIQTIKVLEKLLDDDMTLGNRAAITRTIQILKGER